MRCHISIIAFLTLGPITSLGAQDAPPSLSPGERVRFSCPELGTDRQEATLLEIRADTLVVEYERRHVDSSRRVRRETVTSGIPLAELCSLEVVTGRRTNAKKGAIIGGSVGAGLILVSAAVMAAGDWGPTVGEFVRPLVVWTAIGAGIGALIGSASHTDTWEEAALGQLRVSVVPRRDGAVLAASVSF